ncbi:16487_t:CDS:10 [Entrophospora sp. SA101]|nr:16487_t:CDS:10 [Entrophospora sp. SA101]
MKNSLIDNQGLSLPTEKKTKLENKLKKANNLANCLETANKFGKQLLNEVFGVGSETFTELIRQSIAREVKTLRNKLDNVGELAETKEIKANDSEQLHGSLIITDYPNLEIIHIPDQKNLTQLQIINNEKLEILDVTNNYRLTRNDNQEKIQQGIYNRFVSSLKPLQNLSRLERFDIRNTDLDSGLEYLPKSIKRAEEKLIKKHSKKFKKKHEEKKDSVKKKLKIEQMQDFKNLKESYKNYGLCKECQQPNTEIYLCQPCAFRYSQQNPEKRISVLTGLPPYTTYDSREKCYKESPHDADLALKICQGLRPQFQIKIPPLLENLIKRCWDANPMKRPAKVRSRKDTEFYRQYKEIEEYNQKLPEEIKFPKYKSHKGTVYTSRLLPTSEIANLLQLQEISSELKETVRGYVKAKNKSLKDQKDAQAKKNVRELEEKLEEELKKRGFATEKMDEIIRYCENYHLLELEQKQISVQGSQDQQTTNQSSTLVVELEQSSEEEIKLSFRQAEEGVEQPADNQVNTNPQQSEISNTIDTEASEQVAVVQNPPNNKEKEIKLKREDFQGKLVAEDYPNLEKLYLRDIKNIDKITLRNLPQLQECTI